MSKQDSSIQNQTALYLYCIGERESLSSLLDDKAPDAIEAGSQLQLITVEDLAAVMSVVPLADYGEEALAGRLAEPAWVAARAMRHESVLEHLAGRVTIIPLRFGTIYLERAGVERMLADRQTELRALVERLREREEWGVNLFCERTKLLEAVASLSPALREISERASRSSAGQAYLLRKKIDAMRTDEARKEIKRVAAEAERALSSASDGAVRLRVRQAEAAEHGELAAKLACLVERTRFAEFRAAAEKLAASQSEAGFRLELTGPWPVYNFVELKR